MSFTNPFRQMRATTRLLSGADREAHRTGLSAAGTEHLLLSALALPDGAARRAFARVGGDPDTLRSAIANHHVEARRFVAQTQSSVHGVFRSALATAREEEQSDLLSAHVMAEVARMEHGPAAEALRDMGIDSDALLDATREELDARRSCVRQESSSRA